YRPELASTPAARDAARFMLLQPPLPLLARAPYAVLAAAAVSSLPRWARWPLRLPYLPGAEATVVRLAGDGLVRTIRWAMTPPPAAA
ncbi:MAG: oxygenase MpaB family protein, partial [Jatrophihabitantaceae bacterium]